MGSLYDLQLQLLRLIRDATAAGIVVWRENEVDPDVIETVAGPLNTQIQFKYPAYNDHGSDRDFVEVEYAGRFMIGTPGWDLTLEILAAGFPEWQSHVTNLRESYERQIRLLAAAIEAPRA